MAKEYTKIEDGVYEEKSNDQKIKTITINDLDFRIDRAQSNIDSATTQKANLEKLKADLLKITKLVV